MGGRLTFTVVSYVLYLAPTRLARPQEVAFDEFHHGYQTARTLNTWLRSTAQGRSLIYVAVVVFLYLLIGGRRYGRPLPLPGTTARRAPVEHIQAMANLFRRGGKRTAILHHYHDRLKRELAHPHRLNPTLADTDFRPLGRALS